MFRLLVHIVALIVASLMAQVSQAGYLGYNVVVHKFGTRFNVKLVYQDVFKQ